MNIYKKFDSVLQFTEYLEHGKVQSPFRGKEYSLNKHYDSWSGTSSFDEAQRLLSFGDKEKAARIEKTVAKVRAQLKPVHRRQICTSVVGIAPHVPNYCAGVPNCMINYITKKMPQKVANVAVNISVSGSISAKDIEDVAVKILSAILRIETAGIKVNLYVCSATTKRGAQQNIGWLIKLKSSQQKLDVLRTAYPLLNPSMLRRHDFRFFEVTEGIKEVFAGSYGAVFEAQELLKTCGIKNAVELSYKNCSGLQIEDIMKKILGQGK